MATSTSITTIARPRSVPRLRAQGRRAWLFAGSELAGQRAAVVMGLVQSAKLHGHDPWAYLKDVPTHLPTHLNSRIDELLPHLWRPAG
jgi:transposase